MTAGHADISIHQKKTMRLQTLISLPIAMALLDCGGRTAADDVYEPTAKPGADIDGGSANDSAVVPVPTATTVAGAVGGVTVHAVETRSLLAVSGDGSELVVAITDVADACDRELVDHVAGETSLLLVLGDKYSQGAAVGNYLIAPEEAVNSANAPTLAASAQLDSFDQSCGDLLHHLEPTAGFVSLATTFPSTPTGTFHLIFANGILDGTFAAPSCTGGGNAAYLACPN